MAIQAGHIVAVPNLDTLTPSQERQQYQPPKRGMVAATAPPNCTVLWEDGKLVPNIPTAYIDRLVSAAVDTTYKGRVCQLQLNSDASLPQSPTLVCTVVDVYQRARDDANPTSALALCRSLTTGVWYEVPVSRLTVLPGR
jgi:hypothetical protein